jgi:hypothetical protein
MMFIFNSNAKSTSGADREITKELIRKLRLYQK